MPPIYTLTLNPGLDRTLTVPALHENTVLRATHSRLDWGGKGFNVSRTLHALGVENIALGLIGGFTGQMLAEGLAVVGITTDLVQIAGETRTNTVIEEAGSGRYLKVNEAGPIVNENALAQIKARIAARLSPGSYCALCGSLPPGVPLDFYAELIELIQRVGGKACLDTSGEALRLGVSAKPFLVKPNREEAEELTGITLDDINTAQRAATSLLDQGATIVALSLGAEGLLLATREANIHVQPPQVAVQTLVGVGDALLAGLLFGLTQDLPLAEVARWGVAAGTAAAVTPGVGVGTLDEISNLVALCRESLLH